jgi:hypothetical protein
MDHFLATRIVEILEHIKKKNTAKPQYHKLNERLTSFIVVLKTLIKLKKESPDYISIKALSKIKETIIRLGKLLQNKGNHRQIR